MKILGFYFAKSGFHVCNLTDYIIIQTTDDASLGEFGDDSVVTKETHTEDIDIPHFDNNMGNLNNLPEVMNLFKVVVVEFIMMRSYLLLTFV